jgi:NADH-quinone oxidoreductase subunit J
LSFAGLNAEFIILILLLLSMVVLAVWTVMAKDLLKSAIALGVTSAILATIMFIMDSYLAAVFELSVCAGLITAIFISTISLTKPRTHEEEKVSLKQRQKRFIYLPFLLLAIGLSLFFLVPQININFAASPAVAEPAAQEVLWNARRTDILGHIIIILAGVFGVAILFKERDHK